MRAVTGHRVGMVLFDLYCKGESKGYDCTYGTKHPGQPHSVTPRRAMGEPLAAATPCAFVVNENRSAPCPSALAG